MTGATGLIGSAVTARLLALGHQVTGVARSVGEAARRMPQVRGRAVDIARTRTAAGWAPALAGVDAVVNCAGALQHGGRDDLEGVHTTGIDALYAAAEQAGIRRVIHISAMGVDRATPTAFSRTKLAGEQALMARDLDWVILRPSVVIADVVFTGVALAMHVGYPLSQGWIVLSIALYLVTGAFWLPVVWMQMKMRRLAAEAAVAGALLPAAYHRLYRTWFAFGFPAFAAVTAIFWLMISRPAIGFIDG
ncbi:DUF2269 family protein [Tistrella bauzanensis]|uniref:DUF2269 family protein n=1 Tax=Tistrella bauzanensis TaxID=657419 RepID=UPI002AC323E5|nr:DUF2269 family protein [Tistrella bauzanensis]